MPPTAGDASGGVTGDSSGSASGSDSGSSSGGSTSASSDTEDGDTTGDTTGTGGAVDNCAQLMCAGHTSCVDNGVIGRCECDPGFVDPDPDDGTLECVTDETCIRLRKFNEECRHIFNGASAVAGQFAMEYCSGDPITKAEMPDITGTATPEDWFMLVENGVDDVALDPESAVTFIDKSVESYISIVLDVSWSFSEEEGTMQPELEQVIGDIRAMITDVTPGAGDPPVYMNFIPFGRAPNEMVEFTDDLSLIDAQLAAVLADPTGYASTNVGGNGSAVFDAAEAGINATSRARAFRDAVSDGGILTSGTVLVITDGRDTSGGELNQDLIASTTNNVISMGIGLDVDDATLGPIGRESSFLAPTMADWTAAFAEVRQRIIDYPEAVFLIGFCSSRVTGDHTVEISLLTSDPMIAASPIKCGYPADHFALGPAGECSTVFFDPDQGECSTRTCGGLSACGGCSDTACCNAGGSCVDPAGASFSFSDGDEQLCSHDPNLASHQASTSDFAFCLPKLDLGDLCTDFSGDTGGPPLMEGACRPGESYCGEPAESEPEECLDAKPVGAFCRDNAECESLWCERTNPKNPGLFKTCQPGVRDQQYDHGAPMFTACVDDLGCERGTRCEEGVCQVRSRDAITCSSPADCLFGRCFKDDGAATGVCSGTSACFFDWESKTDPRG